MKYALFLALFAALALSTCKKQDQPCDGCTVTIINSTQYNVVVKMDGATRFTMSGYETRTLQIFDEKGHRVQGDIQTGYAHTDLDATIYCGPQCNNSTLTVRL
jgi:hypothetical protein